jgi:hypothetical protein
MPGGIVEANRTVVNVREPIPALWTVHAGDQRVRLQKAVDIRRTRQFSTRRKDKLLRCFEFYSLIPLYKTKAMM